MRKLFFFKKILEKKPVLWRCFSEEEDNITLGYIKDLSSLYIYQMVYSRSGDSILLEEFIHIFTRWFENKFQHTGFVNDFKITFNESVWKSESEIRDKFIIEFSTISRVASIYKIELSLREISTSYEE